MTHFPALWSLPPKRVTHVWNTSIGHYTYSASAVNPFPPSRRRHFACLALFSSHHSCRSHPGASLRVDVHLWLVIAVLTVDWLDLLLVQDLSIPMIVRSSHCLSSIILLAVEWVRYSGFGLCFELYVADGRNLVWKMMMMPITMLI